MPGPNGLAYDVGCRRGAANCYREAGRLCPSGYMILDKNEGRYVLIPTDDGPVASKKADHMLIQCKPTSVATR